MRFSNLSPDRPTSHKSSIDTWNAARNFLATHLQEAVEGTTFLYQFDVDGTAAGYTLSANDTRFSPQMVKAVRALQALPNVVVEINTSSPPERNVLIQRASRVAIPGHTVKGDTYLSYVAGKPQLSANPHNEHLLPLYLKIRAELERQLGPDFTNGEPLVVDDPRIAVEKGLIYFDFKGPETSFQAKGSALLTERTEEVVRSTYQQAAEQWLQESKDMAERSEVVARFKDVKFVENVGNVEVAVELANGWNKAKAFVASLTRLETNKGVFWGDDTGDITAFKKIRELAAVGFEVLGMGVRNQTEFYEDGSVKFGATDPKVLEDVSAIVETHSGMAELTLGSIEKVLEQNPHDRRLDVARRIVSAPDRNFGPIDHYSGREIS